MRNRGFAFACPLALALDILSRRDGGGYVGLGGALEPVFGIVTNFDVAGETWADAVDGDAAGNIAVGVRCASNVRNTSG